MVANSSSILSGSFAVFESTRHLVLPTNPSIKSDVDTKLLKGSVRNADGAISVPVFNGDFQRLARGILRLVAVVGGEVRGSPGRTAVLS